MAEVAIETKKLTKRFGLVTAVDKADMHVIRGAIYGLIGKKGAGKSTMLRMLAGLQKPTAGSYEVFGTEMNGKCAGGARRRVGIVTEGWFTVPGWKLEDAVKRQCRLLGIPGKEKAEEVLGITGLKSLNGCQVAYDISDEFVGIAPVLIEIINDQFLKECIKVYGLIAPCEFKEFGVVYEP